MQATNLRQSELLNAIRRVNQRYRGNITWLNYAYSHDYATPKRFRLAVVVVKPDPKEEDEFRAAPGVRLGYDLRRRLHSACWHVHGYLFDEILELAPKAVIRTGGRKIYVDPAPNNRGEKRVMNNWLDILVQPYKQLYESARCECDARGLVTNHAATATEQTTRDQLEGGW